MRGIVRREAVSYAGRRPDADVPEKPEFVHIPYRKGARVMQVLLESPVLNPLEFPILAATALAASVSFAKAQAFSGIRGNEAEIDETADMYVLLGENEGGWLDDLEETASDFGKPVVAVFGNRKDALAVLKRPSFICASEAEVLGLKLRCLNGLSPEDALNEAFRLAGETDPFDAAIVPVLPKDALRRGLDAASLGDVGLVLYGNPEESVSRLIGKTAARGVAGSETVFFERRLRPCGI